MYDGAADKEHGSPEYPGKPGLAGGWEHGEEADLTHQASLARMVITTLESHMVR